MNAAAELSNIRWLVDNCWVMLLRGVAAGEIDEAGAAAFFRDNTVPLNGE